MVPRAAILLSTLAWTIAVLAQERPFHGPLRISKAHERRNDFNKTLYPVGTGPPRSFSDVKEATDSSSVVSSGSSHAGTLTITSGIAASEPPSRNSTTTASTSAESSLLSADSNSNTTSIAQYPSLGLNNSTVPTPLISVIYETVVTQNTSREHAQVTTDRLRQTVVEPPTVDGSISEAARNDSSLALPTGYTVASGTPSKSANRSDGQYLLSSRISAARSSSARIFSTGHGPLLENLTAVYTFNPPRPTACSGATLNIKNASLDYWYTQTYTQVDSTFLIEFNENDTSTGWTLLPASSSLDITSAIANPQCSSATSFDAGLGQSGIAYSCSETPTPAAKATSVVEQTAYTPPNATTSNGNIPDVVIAPTPAAITVANGDGTTTYHAGTSVVHFSRYEIVSRQSYRHWNGSIGCIEQAQAYDLPEAASFEYQEETSMNESLAVGKLGRFNAALLRVLSNADVDLPRSVSLGDLEAEPTVMVVVEKVVAAAATVPQAFVGPSTKLETPTATLPPGLSFERTTPTEPGTVFVPFTAHVESSADRLDVPSKTTKKPIKPQTTSGPPGPGGDATDGDFSIVDNGAGGPTGDDDNGGVFVAIPFVAHLENGDVTLAVPVDPTSSQSVVTVERSGTTVTATRISGSAPLETGAVDVGRIVSIISSAAQPTNALEVLNQAQKTFSASGPSSALAAGIGLQPSSSGEDDSSVALPFNTGSHGASADGSASGSGSGEGSHSQGPALIIGGTIFTATRAANALVLDGQTLAAGGPPITVAGQAVSLSPGATTVAIGGSVVDVGSIADVDGSAVFNVGDKLVTATRAAAGIIVASQTLSAGGPAVTIDGSILSLNAEGTALAIAGSMIDIGTRDSIGAVANIPVIQLGFSRFTANAATQFNINGMTLTPGGQIINSDTTLSLAPSATVLVVNGETQQLSAPIITSAPLLTIDGTVYQPNLGSTYDIGSSLLTPGGQIVVSGTTLSLPIAGPSIIVNGIARSIGAGAPYETALPTITAPPALLLDGTILSPNAGTTYSISGQTLTPGGAITIENAGDPVTLSLGVAADALFRIVEGNTYTSYIGMVGAAPSGAPVLTIDGEAYTAVEYNAGSGATYVVNGQTLVPGGTVTLPGPNGEEKVSLVPAGTAIIVTFDGTTSTSVIENAYGVRPTRAPLLTIGGEVFTAINNGPTYSIDGNTLTPGEVEKVTINGHTYIVGLSPYATILEVVEVGANGEVVTTVFETLFPATAASATTTMITDTTDTAAATAGATASELSPTGSIADESTALRSSSVGMISLTFAASILALALLL